MALLRPSLWSESSPVSGLYVEAHRWTLRLLVASLVLVGAAVTGVHAAGGFEDDDGGVHEPAIDALAAEGILAGTECDRGLICPGEPFRRWIMAVWMVRAFGESPSETPSRFTDVDPDAWWAPMWNGSPSCGSPWDAPPSPPGTAPTGR